MDHADSGGQRLACRAEPDGRAVQLHGSVVIVMHAGDDLHQCGFARAVLADKAVDLARFESEIHVLKCGHTTEGLTDSRKTQNRHLLPSRAISL